MDRLFNVVFGSIMAVVLTLLIIFRQNTTLFIIIALIGIIFAFNAYFLVRYLQHKNRRIITMAQTIRDKENLINRKSTAESKLIADIPVGIILINKAFDIEWANTFAKKIFQNNLESRNLELLHQELKDKIQSGQTEQPFVIKIYEQEYDIIFDAVEDTLYLYTVTEREEIKRQHHRLTNVLGVLHLDNFEESISVLDMQERNEIQAKYLGALEDWAEDKGFYLMPISTSKLVVFMHRRDLDVLIEEQFDILEKINGISKDNEFMVTLSGGIVCSNLPLNKLGELAEDALELSLNRGGDQIVINIQGEALRYFGGNTNTQEKRTRISSRINAQKLAMLFAEADQVFIVPHHHPDTDALGAAIGVLKIAQTLKVDASIVLNFNAIDKTVKKILQLMEYEYVTFLENFVSPEEALSMATRKSLLVIVDHHSMGQTIDEKLVRSIPNKVIIDHHRKLTDYIEGSRLSYIEPYASSSTELVVEMLNVYKKDVVINPFEATVMLSGIIVDTNNFMYRTGARTFEAAAVLRKYGADTYKVKNILRDSLKEIQIKSQLLMLAEVIKKRYSIVVVPDDIDSDRTLLAQVADNLLEIDNTVAAFAIGKIDNQNVGISARSLEGFNVQTVMEKFGGGGHLNNAGAQVKTDDILSIKTTLIDVLENSIQEEKPMKVILKKDLKNKGKKGDVIEVAAGYGNYLLTSKQAIEATPENMQIIEDEKTKAEEEIRQELDEAKALKQRIDFRAVKIYVKIGENGKLYGKITSKQIADAFKEQHSIDIDKRKIQLDNPITALGTHRIDIRLHKDVTATFELLVLEQ